MGQRKFLSGQNLRNSSSNDLDQQQQQQQDNGNNNKMRKPNAQGGNNNNNDPRSLSPMSLAKKISFKDWLLEILKKK